jgi:hypothetical protein
MDIFDNLAGNLAGENVEATTFSIDALGRLIFSTWEQVNRSMSSLSEPACSAGPRLSYGVQGCLDSDVTTAASVLRCAI